MAANAQTPARDLYAPGLSHLREAVISEHFMHRLNNRNELALLSGTDYAGRALRLPVDAFRRQWLPLLTRAASQFAEQRVEAAKARALKNHGQYGLGSPGELTSVEMITEVLYDRQFLRSSSENVSRATLVRKIRSLVERRLPIEMVIPALPYKCTSPLKCRGAAPDLAEVGFLLSLFEMARAVDILYRDEVGDPGHSLSRFTVISDGRRFADFLLEPDPLIANYQRDLNRWVASLSIGDHVRIQDYRELLTQRLSPAAQAEKARIRQRVLRRYREQMTDLLDPDDMPASLTRAIRSEPDPETFFEEGRFVPLLKSLVYTINYRAISEHGVDRGEQWQQLYATLTQQIFAADVDHAPATASSSQRGARRNGHLVPAHQVMRRQMLHQVWDATMHYLAEIRSDRDMASDPVGGCYPDAIRWTIHAKRGQLAIQSNPSSGIHVQPWHGAGVLKRTRKTRAKLCALPCAMLENVGATPVLLDTNQCVNGEAASDLPAAAPPAGDDSRVQQPLFYIHPDLQVSTLPELQALLAASYTRQRK